MFKFFKFVGYLFFVIYMIWFDKEVELLIGLKNLVFDFFELNN